MIQRCGGVDKTQRLNTRQDVRWAVKEELNQHQTGAFLLMVAGRWTKGERRNPPCYAMLQEHFSVWVPRKMGSVSPKKAGIFHAVPFREGKQTN